MACNFKQTKMMTGPWPECCQSIHQRLFMKKNKNLERKVFSVDLEHTCTVIKLEFSKQDLGYVNI